MFDAYQTKSVTWNAVTLDEWQVVTKTPTTIKVRAQVSRHIGRQLAGKIITAGALDIIVNKAQKPSPNDTYKIDGQEYAIVLIREIMDFDPRGYEVILV